MTAKVAQILQNKFTAIRISKSSVTQMAKLRFQYLTVYNNGTLPNITKMCQSRFKILAKYKKTLNNCQSLLFPPKVVKYLQIWPQSKRSPVVFF